MTDRARKLVEDLQEAGIVRGSDGRSRKPDYPPARVELRSLDPQDAVEVEDAFQATQEALLGLGEALLRAGPPSTSGAAERLSWIRGAVDELERGLGIERAPEVKESLEVEPAYVTRARVALQKSQGLLYDAQGLLRDRGRDRD